MNTHRHGILLAGSAAMLALWLLPQDAAAQKMSPREQMKKELAIQEQMAKEQMAKEKAAQELAAKKKQAARDTAAPGKATPAAPTPTKAIPAPVIPLTEPPQDLKDESGNYELDLVDPFQRGSSKTPEEEAMEGLSSTALGEISEEFRILAIIIPEDGSSEPMALIRLQDESNPQVVMRDDLVQIKRRPPDRRAQNRTRAGDEPTLEESALNALESYSFYLQVREIHPTYIEAFQKKSPNESIILR
ncbi:MAG: hypothetical protein KDM64_02385 [Verrucomicrobiae bacterium]|nr:hypothetical protein [Verrucomicrobiae bacterium]